ncbi:hypothetical protein BE21_29150 [Sorangium cellulosum]|uniref:Uncharacterized protein n=1 Tax=Sorangium cellulosum TaxID=56 RepID=A0A150TSE6_SORCE|nr:hypothetical protein BE21_29150 [Sorangium cellulosum]
MMGMLMRSRSAADLSPVKGAPVEVFFSYADKDTALFEELIAHVALLQRRGDIVGWHARRIGPGEDWASVIDERLRTAHLILLLVSADFLASDYCYGIEMTCALEQQRSGEAKVIPILLRPCDVHLAPFADLACLPRDGKPVTSWSNRDEAWKEVACGIRAAVDALSNAASTPVSGALQGSPKPTVTPRSTRPVPLYPDKATQALCEWIEEARARRRKLHEVGADATEVDGEIRELRRKLREGGQLRAGDALDDGRYLLVRRLGRGGFASVWEAHDEQRRARVAIKVLHGELASDVIRRERFFRGARIMAELADEGIVGVLDPYAEEGGFHYFVMALAAGGDLRQAVLSARVTCDALLDIIARAGGALARAHQRGLIHRDVKPANILLTASGAPLLTDFDLVGGADTTGGTRTGAIGSWIYAAPELMHRPQDADPRADVYGLGMTAIFGLHGAELPMDVLRGAESIIDGLPCNTAVKATLRRAVDWSPAARFADAAAFCAELQRARELASHIVTDCTSSPAEATSPPVSVRSPVLRADPTSTHQPSGDDSLVVIRHPYTFRDGQRWTLGQELTRIGRGRGVDLDLEDNSISRKQCCIERRGDRWFLRDLGSANGTWVNESLLEKDAESELFAGDRIRLGHHVLLRFFGGKSAARDRSRTLFDSGPVDELTGVASRARVLDALADVMAVSARHDSHMSALAIHVDQMDRIDDDESDPVGDSVLRNLALLLESTLGPGEHVGRLGGEAFLIVLPDGHTDQVNRIYSAVRAHEWHVDGQRLRVTVSIGRADNPGWCNWREKSAACLIGDAQSYARCAQLHGGNFDFMGVDTNLSFSVSTPDELINAGFPKGDFDGSLSVFGIGDEHAVMQLDKATMALWEGQLFRLVHGSRPGRQCVAKGEGIFKGHVFRVLPAAAHEVRQIVGELREEWATFPVPLLHQRSLVRSLRVATLGPEEVREYGDRSFDVLLERVRSRSAP